MLGLHNELLICYILYHVTRKHGGFVYFRPRAHLYLFISNICIFIKLLNYTIQINSNRKSNTSSQIKSLGVRASYPYYCSTAWEDLFSLNRCRSTASELTQNKQNVFATTVRCQSTTQRPEIYFKIICEGYAFVTSWNEFHDPKNIRKKFHCSRTNTATAIALSVDSRSCPISATTSSTLTKAVLKCRLIIYLQILSLSSISVFIPGKIMYDTNSFSGVFRRVIQLLPHLTRKNQPHVAIRINRKTWFEPFPL